MPNAPTGFSLSVRDYVGGFIVLLGRCCREADVDGTPFGRYRLMDLLGRGGMGEVWQAYDTAVMVALSITGWVSARLGGADPRRAALRVMVGGALAMAITFAIGHLVGTAVT